MAEYIECDALIAELEKAPPYFENGDIQYGISVAIGIVKKVSAADVVPVVRCKDCVFWDTESKGLSDEYVCKMHSIVAVHSRYTNPTDYCSYGERSNKK
jgi:hypothetical protein